MIKLDLKRWYLLFILLAVNSCSVKQSVIVESFSKLQPELFQELLREHPDSIVKLALINLQNANSFRYQYQFRSDRPHRISAYFQGAIILPTQEERNGEYVVNDKKRIVKIKARGNYQYQYQAKSRQWQLKPRDEEGDLFMTLNRVIANAKYYLIEENEAALKYTFHPNVAFLDPTFSTQIKGYIVVDKKLGLPQKIFAHDSLQVIYWQIDFFDFNRVGGIKFPFLPNTELQLISTQRPSQAEKNKISQALKRRLELSGESFEIRTKGKNLFLIRLEILESTLDFRTYENLLTAMGNLDIHIDNESLPLLNKSNIQEIRIWSFEPYPELELKLDSSGIALINDALKEKEKLYGKVYLDKRELAIFDIDRYNFLDKIFFRILSNKNEVMNILAIIKSGSLSTPLEIKEIRKLR